MRRRTVLAAPATLLAPAVRAQTAERWDFPTGFVDGNFHTQTLRAFAEDVKRRTDGKLEFRLHTNNTLLAFSGIRRAVQQGQVPAGEILLSLYGNEDPIMEADAIPFLAVGYDQARRLYEAQKPFLERRFQQIGLRMLYSVPWPGQGIYSKRPVNGPEDLRGLRIRTPTPASSRLAELVGAVPTVVQSGEVPQAFATNVVTAMMTSSPTGVDTRAWDFVRMFYTTDSWHPRNAVIVSERVWRRLDAPTQAALTEAAAEAEPKGWAASRAADEEAKRRMAAEGMEVLPPPQPLVDALKAAGARLSQEWAAKAGEGGQAVLRAMGQTG
ncbi:TRAP transporter substrate-binding protein [Roseomonas sp. CCTCC AB2023176]|uniref:TRAP transporter substrate-binding protein n=1 Tax=Roseomonas sp. CCTCC AB2023176 TaxID=3342640 RepID=UPI0035E0DBD0